MEASCLCKTPGPWGGPPCPGVRHTGPGVTLLPPKCLLEGMDSFACSEEEASSSPHLGWPEREQGEVRKREHLHAEPPPQWGTTAVLPTLLQWVMLPLVSPQLIEVQAEYHRKSLALLQAVLPQIKAQQGKCRPSLERGGG